jgi:SAM-dependent methyltransferase
MDEINIFDRNLVKKHRNLAAENFSHHDFIKNLTAEYVTARLLDIGDKYEMALDFACHNGILGKKLQENHLTANLICCDLSANMVKNAPGLRVVADEEFLPFAPRSFNLIASSMSLQWVNDLPGMLIQMRQCLKQDGVFIATMPGALTLKELRHCLMESEIEITGGTAPHISPFADVKTLGQLMQRAGFARPVADSEVVQISYADIFSIFADLKNMGEGNALIKRSRCLRKDVVQSAAKKYQMLYPDIDGGILATIEIITITGLAG